MVNHLYQATAYSNKSFATTFLGLEPLRVIIYWVGVKNNLHQNAFSEKILTFSIEKLLRFRFKRQAAVGIQYSAINLQLLFLLPG